MTVTERVSLGGKGTGQDRRGQDLVVGQSGLGGESGLSMNHFEQLMFR